MERILGVEFERIEARSGEPGAPGAPVIVFLHEGLGSAALWRDFPRKLCEATACGGLVYSRRGYGGSDPIELPRPLDYMEREGERELPALLDALAITNPILFGHSDGASIALVAAAAMAARGLAVRGLILEAPHVFCEELSVQSIAKARAAYEQGNLREKLARWHGANVDNAFRGWNGAWLDPRFRDFNLERYLPAVRARSLVLQGLDDEYGTRAQVDSIAQKSGAPVQVELLAGCGHAPHKDQLARTLALCTGFIERLA